MLENRPSIQDAILEELVEKGDKHKEEAVRRYSPDQRKMVDLLDIDDYDKERTEVEAEMLTRTENFLRGIHGEQVIKGNRELLTRFKRCLSKVSKREAFFKLGAIALALFFRPSGVCARDYSPESAETRLAAEQGDKDIRLEISEWEESMERLISTPRLEVEEFNGLLAIFLDTFEGLETKRYQGDRTMRAYELHDYLVEIFKSGNFESSKVSNANLEKLFLFFYHDNKRTDSLQKYAPLLHTLLINFHQLSLQQKEQCVDALMSANYGQLNGGYYLIDTLEKAKLEPAQQRKIAQAVIKEGNDWDNQLLLEKYSPLLTKNQKKEALQKTREAGYKGKLRIQHVREASRFFKDKDTMRVIVHPLFESFWGLESSDEWKSHGPRAALEEDIVRDIRKITLPVQAQSQKVLPEGPKQNELDELSAMILGTKEERKKLVQEEENKKRYFRALETYEEMQEFENIASSDMPTLLILPKVNFNLSSEEQRKNIIDMENVSAYINTLNDYVANKPNVFYVESIDVGAGTILDYDRLKLSKTLSPEAQITLSGGYIGLCLKMGNESLERLRRPITLDASASSFDVSSLLGAMPDPNFDILQEKTDQEMKRVRALFKANPKANAKYHFLAIERLRRSARKFPHTRVRR